MRRLLSETGSESFERTQGTALYQAPNYLHEMKSYTTVSGYALLAIE